MLESRKIVLNGFFIVLPNFCLNEHKIAQISLAPPTKQLASLEGHLSSIQVLFEAEVNNGEMTVLAGERISFELHAGSQ